MGAIYPAGTSTDDWPNEKVWRLPRWARYLLGLFGVWLSLHFAFGWFTLSEPLPF